jgi:hypothetical protein
MFINGGTVLGRFAVGVPKGDRFCFDLNWFGSLGIRVPRGGCRCNGCQQLWT